MTVRGNAREPPPSGPPPQLSVPPPFVPPDELMGSLSRGSLVLRVSGRVLWSGSKAVPLHNIGWVDAFKVQPDWGTALLRVLKWLFFGAVLIVASGLVDRLVTGTEVTRWADTGRLHVTAHTQRISPVHRRSGHFETRKTHFGQMARLGWLSPQPRWMPTPSTTAA
ncbi:hypothetical protein IPZ70_07125 [Streptomyces polychromogenes]|nr:hypothetical protein [Streptomyces polychromogenes]